MTKRSQVYAWARRKLLEQQRDISRTLRGVQGGILIHDDGQPRVNTDDDDSVQSAQTELSALQLDALSRLQHEVQDALARLNNGSFGVCVRCQEFISDIRLTARPSASHCLRCQEQLER